MIWRAALNAGLAVAISTGLATIFGNPPMSPVDYAALFCCILVGDIIRQIWLKRLGR